MPSHPQTLNDDGILSALLAGLHTPEQLVRLNRILAICRSALPDLAWKGVGNAAPTELRGIRKADGTHPRKHAYTTEFRGGRAGWSVDIPLGNIDFRLAWQDRSQFIPDPSSTVPEHPRFRRDETDERLSIELSVIGLFEEDGARTLPTSLVERIASIANNVSGEPAQQDALAEWINVRSVLLQQVGISFSDERGWHAWWKSHALRDRHGGVGSPRGAKDGKPRMHVPALTRVCAGLPCQNRTGPSIPAIPEERAFAHLAAIAAALAGSIALASSDEVPFGL
jgi:hypothetical protein